MDISKKAHKVSASISRAQLKLYLSVARNSERRDRASRRRKTGPTPAQAVAMVRAFKQDLATLLALGSGNPVPSNPPKLKQKLKRKPR